MTKKAVKSFVYFILAGIICGTAFYFYPSLEKLYQPLISRLATVIRREIIALTPACQKPISYSLGGIDKQFGLSEDQTRQAVDEAAAIWSVSWGQPLFAYAASGTLTVNFIYDYRQSATDKMKQLGIAVDNNQISYDRVRNKYDAWHSQYQIQQAELDKLIKEFGSELADYNAQVAEWNASGGAPAAEYARLKQISSDLAAKQRLINQRTDSANALAADLNALVTTLNSLAAKLNLSVKQYNNIGGQTGQEFQEGSYQDSAAGQVIDIYEFKSRQQLVRLLAHELGHALGLEHTSNTSDIMYYLNDSENNNLTANDSAALRAKCGGK